MKGSAKSQAVRGPDITEVRRYERRLFDSVIAEATPDAVFDFIDDHRNLSSHMSESSWRMAGARMSVTMDDDGRLVGSRIRMEGRVLGVPLFLDEVVTERVPARRKAWATVGEPGLVVIGAYSMWVGLEPAPDGTRVTVGIEYDAPRRARWLGTLFGGTYAKWCLGQMTRAVGQRFGRARGANGAAS